MFNYSFLSLMKKVVFLPVFIFSHQLDESNDFDVNASVVYSSEASACEFAESKVKDFESLPRYRDFVISYCVEQLTLSSI